MLVRPIVFLTLVTAALAAGCDSSTPTSNSPTSKHATASSAKHVGETCGDAKGDCSQAPATAKTAVDAPTAQASGEPGAAGAAGDKVTLPSGVAYQDIKVGSGTAAKAGDTVNSHATGWLTDGTKFWSSHDGPNEPIDFTLKNPGGVIQGWVDGVPGMMPGGVRKLWIPSALAYGARGRPPVIPPNSDLVFEVELVAIR